MPTKQLDQLISKRVLRKLATHDALTPSDSAKSVAAQGASRDGVIDLSCHPITGEVVTILEGAVKMETPVKELNLQCCTIESVAQTQLLRLLRSATSIEVILTAGCLGISNEWLETVETLCNANRTNNNSKKNAVKNKEEQRRYELARQLFEENAPLIVRGHYNGYLALEAEEAREWRMILRAAKYIPEISAENEEKEVRLSSLLESVREIVTLQRQRRIVIFNHQIKMKLVILESREAAERSIVEQHERELRKKIWQQNLDHYEVKQLELKCRLSEERVARSAMLQQCLLFRQMICNAERDEFGGLCDEYDHNSATLMANQREQKQRAEDDKRRARQRAEDDARNRAHRMERQRYEAAQQHAAFLAHRGKTISQEESIRSRLLNAERTIFASIRELFLEVNKVLAMNLKLERSLSEVDSIQATRPFVALNCATTPNNPLFVFELSGSWSVVDPAMSIELKMPVGFDQMLDQAQEIARSTALATQTLRRSRQKKMRQLWDHIVESAKKAKVRLDFTGMSETTSPQQQPLEISGELSASTISHPTASDHMAMWTLSNTFANIFDESKGTETSRAEFLSSDEVVKLKTSPKPGRLSISLKDEHGEVVKKEKNGTLRGKHFNGQHWESVSVDVEVDGDVSFASLSSALRSIEYFCNAKHFGPVLHLVLEIDATIGPVRSKAFLPICVCQQLIGTQSKSWTCEGTMELNLGAPWVVRDVPLVRPQKTVDETALLNGSASVVQLENHSLEFSETTAPNTLPDLVFDARSATDTNMKHLGFAGATIEISLGEGCTEDDRVFINTKVTKSMKLILGVLSVGGQMIGRVEEGSFLKTKGGLKHIIRLVSHTEVKKETVASLLNSLRYCCVAKNPIVGMRHMAIRVSPAERQGSCIPIPIDVLAVDVPTELHLGSNICVFRARCPVDTMDRFERQLIPSSSPLAPFAEVVDPDTEFFSGGYLKVTLGQGMRAGDHLWVRDSDAHAPHPTVHPGIRVRPSIGDLGNATIWYANKKLGDMTVIANGYSSSSETRAEGKDRTEHVSHISIAFSEDTPCPLEGVQELVRNICFTSTKIRPPVGAREVSWELLVGETAERVDNCGRSITLDSSNEVIFDTTTVQVTASAVRVASRTAEFVYLEGSGIKRITPTETLADEESHMKLWSGFARFDVNDPSHHDMLGVRPLDETEFFDTTLGTINVVQSEVTAAKLQNDLQKLGDCDLLDETVPDGIPVDLSRSLSRSRSCAEAAKSSDDLAQLSMSGSQTLKPTFFSGWKLPYCSRDSNEPDRSEEQHNTSKELAKRGFTSQFQKYVDRLSVFEFIRNGAPLATACAVPGSIAIGWSGSLNRKEVSYLLRCLTYENTDKKPELLNRIGRVALFDGFCTSVAVFPIQILPVDDPLEILVHQPVVRHRINASELNHFDDENTAARLDTHRVGVGEALLLTEEIRSSFGLVRLFRTGCVTLEDPDTPFWDKGRIVIEVASGGVRGEGIQLLSIEQQVLQYKQAKTEISHLLDFDGKKLSLCAYDSEGSLYVVEEHLATVTMPSKGQSATNMHISFKKRHTSSLCVDLSVLTHIMNCVCYSFGGNLTPNIISRVVKVSISDGRNPTPGKAQVNLEVSPPLFALKDKSVTGEVVSTRTKQVIDTFPVFQKVLLNTGMSEKEMITKGYIEVFSSGAPFPGDTFQLRLSGSQFSIRDGFLMAAKDIVGQLYMAEGYVRLDFLPKSRGSTQRRLQEFLKIIYFQYSEKGERQLALVFGDTTSNPGLVEHSMFKVKMTIQ